jgi:hypothetical protein
MPSAEEVADSLGLSEERRKFLSDLASTVTVRRSSKNGRHAGVVQKSSSGRKRAAKKVA